MKRPRAPEAAQRPPPAVLPFGPIQHPNLTDRVYDALKQRILSQDLELGARVKDDELADQLGVSRTPVREALMRLHREGLVQIVPRSGTMVATFSETDVDQIYDVRMALEALATRRATKKLRPEQLRRLRRMHEQAEAAFKNGDSGPLLDFDREMHQMLLEGSGNRKLQEIMATINDLVALFRNLGARLPAHKGFNYRHHQIVRALLRRDPEAAARAVADHIQGAKEQLLRDLKERQVLKFMRGEGEDVSVTTRPTSAANFGALAMNVRPSRRPRAR